MFRPIRKKKNEISESAAKALLKSARRGVLAMTDGDSYPYAVPINYLYSEEENKIYFHGSKAGYKAELLAKNEKVCFTVCGEETIKDEQWAPYLRSAVVFGRCRVISDRAAADEILRKFAGKYYPDEALIEEEIAAAGKAVVMREIEIDHVSGKEVQER